MADASSAQAHTTQTPVDRRPPDPLPGPGVRARPRYFTAAEQQPRKDSRPLGFIFPQANDSQSYYDLRAAASKRPDNMPIHRVNIVHTQHEEVDECKVDAAAPSPPGLFLQLALAAWDKTTRIVGPRSELLLAHRDDGSAVSLINPTMLSDEPRLSLHWVKADVKLLSVTNHDVQGMAQDQMCKIIISFQKAEGTGWINTYTKLYMCTILPYPILLGRPVIEEPDLHRFGNSERGMQRFGPGLLCTRFVRPPKPSPVAEGERIPVYALFGYAASTRSANYHTLHDWHLTLPHDDGTSRRRRGL